jgi:hypothetical protein
VHIDKKDVSCLMEMTVKHGEQGADSVGTVGRHRKNGRHAAGWHGAPHLLIVGTAHDVGARCREVQRLCMDQASGGCRLHRPWSVPCQKTW